MSLVGTLVLSSTLKFGPCSFARIITLNVLVAVDILCKMAHNFVSL
jgi:hypothetical protein